MQDGVCNPIRNVSSNAGRGLQPHPKRFLKCRTGFATPSETFPQMPDGVCNPIRNVSSNAGRGLQPRPKRFECRKCRTGFCRMGFVTSSEMFRDSSPIKYFRRDCKPYFIK
ncbi:Uncharacterized protein dnm_016970 [Desulfonema magnum]|uniref:Uncharacterized protein n=1 Tax=Desulfonema magnum TaxID=45655 RepID=A0A975BI00_9BACT|nr:Uncharacterized protein dnm_016970 [Desulfonema magnum]